MEFLDVFDISSTILISIALFVTLPIASFVYYRLLFHPPYAGNYSFKLIVFNGVSELLSGFTYFIVFQLTSFPFMYGFYAYIQEKNLTIVIGIINNLANGLALHSGLFVALNRLKSIIFFKNENDAKFFLVSSILSFLLSLPKSILFTQAYREENFGDGPVFIPSNTIHNQVLLTLAYIQICAVSAATFTINVILAFYIFRKTKLPESIELKRFHAERGLMVTSIVSYIFYSIYMVNNLIARFFGVLFCGFAQFLFLGLASITPFWCMMIFVVSIRKSMLSRKKEDTAAVEFLQVFDFCSTILISIALFVTLPIASFVYYRLLFHPPYAGNYSFKLIVFNGVSELLSGFTYFIVFQLTSFPFMYGFYAYIQEQNLDRILGIINNLAHGLALHSGLFVACNRLTTIILFTKRGNDARFFLISFVLSFIMSLPKAIMAVQSYEERNWGNGPVFLPINNINNQILLTLTYIQICVVSATTFAINVILAFYIFRKTKLPESVELKRFHAERGLMVTSIVSYIFYSIYMINNLSARFFNVLFCGFAQFLFLGVASITPFWCMMIFVVSIRKSMFSWKKEDTAVVNIKHTRY